MAWPFQAPVFRECPVFNLILSARAKWRRLDGSNNLSEVIEGVPFKDGIKQIKHAT